MAFKMKGWSPFTKNGNDDEYDIVIQYDKDGNIDENWLKEHTAKITKQEQQEMIEKHKDNIKFNPDDPNWKTLTNPKRTTDK